MPPKIWGMADSLQKIIDNGASATASESSLEKLPSLTDTISAAVPETPAPAVAPTDTPPETSPPADESPLQAGFNFREQLKTTLGVDTSVYQSEEEAFQDYTSALNQAGEVLNSETYQKFQSQQEQFEAFLASQNAEPAPDPAVEPPAPEVPASPFATATLSEEARLMAENGMIARGEDGVWTAKNPALKSLADEYNQHDASIRANALKLTRDPVGFVQKLIESQQKPSAPAADISENEVIKGLTEQVAAMKAVLDAQAASAQESQLETWRKSTPLFKEDGSHTQYAQTYMKLEQQVRSETPEMPDLQVHERVLKYLDMTGVKPEAPAPAAPETPKVSMVEKARSRAATNGNGVNRLKEFAGEVPASKPSVPQGKGGLPSLSGLIAQSESALTE